MSDYSSEYPKGFAERVASAIPEKETMRSLHIEAEELARTREADMNRDASYNVATGKKFRAGNSFGKSTSSSPSHKVQQYNASHSNPYVAAEKNAALQKLIEERARKM